MTNKWIVYRGYDVSKVVELNMTFKNGKRYSLPEKTAKLLVEQYAGFSWSKKEEQKP